MDTLCTDKLTAKEKEMLGRLETQLRTHDWNYEFSDQYSTFLRGEAEKNAIRSLLSSCEASSPECGEAAKAMYGIYKQPENRKGGNLGLRFFTCPGK